MGLHLSRRRFLRSALGATAVAGLGLTPRLARAGELPPTESNMEGPYYRAGAPFRNQLYADDEPGTWMLVWGHVYGTDATPLSGALVDVWQANNDGVYDNTSADFLGRGVQLADDEGWWYTWSVWPGYYPGRPWHFHLKANQKGYRPLTTQLYFKNDPRAERDPSYRPSLALDWFEYSEGVYAAYFDIVLPRQ